MLPQLDRVEQEVNCTIDLQRLFAIASRNKQGVHFDTPMPTFPFSGSIGRSK